MTDKPDLTLIKTTPKNVLPKESFDSFKQWIMHDGLKPSAAIRKFMKAYDCSGLHVTTVVHLLEHAYPDLDLGRRGFRFRIVDSAYPNSDPKQFSDDDFDQGIEELLSLPPAEW